MSGGWEGERAGTDSAYGRQSLVTTSSERRFLRLALLEIPLL
jgi:hypothetical protein